MRISTVSLSTAVALFAALTLGACNNPQQAAGRAPGSLAQAAQKPDLNSLIIIYGFDLNGKLETCGCAIKMLGGLPKRATVINTYRAKNNLLLLEGGHLFPEVNDFEKFKLKILVEILNEMKYDGVGLGALDLRLGVKETKGLFAQAKFPIITTNIFVRGQGNRLVNPATLNADTKNVDGSLSSAEVLKEALGQSRDDLFYGIPALIVKRGNLKVAILSVVDHLIVPDGVKDVLVVDPILTLNAVMKRIGNDADALVLMIDGQPQIVQRVVDTFPQFTVYLSGGPGAMGNHIDVRKAGAGAWANVFNNGKYVAVVQAQKSSQGITAEGQIQDILDTYADDPPVKAILDNDYRPKLKEMFKFQQFPSGAKFVTALTCSTCHMNAYRVFENSGHHKALDTLKAKGNEYNLDCVSCHVAYDSADDIEYPIQCTTCHAGIGDDHVQAARAGKPVVPEKSPPALTVEFCGRCHTDEQSPDFRAKAAVYFAKIKHRK
jgi:hypothetical protein